MTRRTVAMAVVAAALYVAMWVGYVQGWPALTSFDNWFLDPLYNFGAAHPAWVTGWQWFCTLLSPGAFRVVLAVPIIWLFVRRQFRLASFLFLTVEFSALVTLVAKGLADRPRPQTALVRELSTSFPSGHALGVMVIVLALLTVLLPLVAAQWRIPLRVLGGVIVVAIGVGRVVLNVHHPSDVLAGWALGYLWFLACLPVLTAGDEKLAALDTRP